MGWLVELISYTQIWEYNMTFDKKITRYLSFVNGSTQFNLCRKEIYECRKLILMMSHEIRGIFHDQQLNFFVAQLVQVNKKENI